MIQGLGTDILEIDRFNRVMLKHSTRFAKRIFSDEEYEYCLKYKDPTPHLAARFSAKEAVAKALGCGIGKDLAFKDIFIERTKSGKPTVRFSEKAQKNFKDPKVELSISHCEKYVTATAIWI